MSWNILGEEVSEGPVRIASRSWLGKDFPWTNGVDAGAVWKDDKAWFFRGSESLRFDLTNGRVDIQPHPINDGWHGLGNAPLDAFVRWNDGHAYAFRGDHYFRIDVDTKTVIGGARSISQDWEGVFPSDLDAAFILWDRQKAYFFRDKQFIRYDLEEGKVDEHYPKDINEGIWRGLRWTEATGLSEAASV
jgi:hypothetical protein